MTHRDLALIVLAGILAVAATVGLVLLALRGKVEGEVAVTGLVA